MPSYPPCYASAGTHILADLYGCAADFLAHPVQIADALLAAAQAAQASVIGQHFHHFGEAQGVTGVLLLQESHMSIHTWPEQGYAALDIFMCGDALSSLALAELMHYFQPSHSQIQTILRGQAPNLV